MKRAGGKSRKRPTKGTSSRDAVMSEGAKQLPQPSMALEVTTIGGEDSRKVYARTVLRPSVSAGVAAVAWTSHVLRSDQQDLTSVVDELAAQAANVGGGNLGRPEAVLVAQMHVLDAMFNNLAISAKRAKASQDGGRAFELLFRLAMKAQSQCRATVETLADIKNPRPVAFVRQANLAAGHMQVNNGDTSRAREIQRSPNELLEGERHAERLDGPKAGEAGASHTALASVVPIDRAKVPRGQSEGESEQLQARGIQP